MQIRTWLSALAIAACTAPFSMAQITGKVTLDGEPPEVQIIDMSAVRECARIHPDPVGEESAVVGEEGELMNVIVFIRPEEGMDLPGEVPDEPAVLDQEGCMYTPRVLPMMTGQQLVVKNSDPFMHNVNAQPRINPGFNFAQMTVDPGRQVPSPRAPETFRVRCDVHPWMTAFIRAFEHPYFDATDEDGKFEINNVQDLPDGEYTLVAWHEKFGEQEQQITVADGKAEAEFTFDAGEARNTPVEADEIVLASASGEKKDKDDGDGCGPKSCCDSK